MASITIHNIDDTIYQLIKKRAEENGSSINSLIREILRKTFVIDTEQNKNLDEFFGSWSNEDYEEFESNVEDTKQINDEDWK